MFRFFKKQPTASQLVLPDRLPGLDIEEPVEVEDGIYIKVGLDSGNKYGVEVSCPEGKESEFTYLLMLLNNGVLFESILEAINTLPPKQCEAIYTDIALSKDEPNELEDTEDEEPLISPLFAINSLKGGVPNE